MRRVGGMLGDDRSVGLFRHDEAKKVFTHLVMRVRHQFGGVFCSGRVRVVPNYRLGLGTLHGHSSERCERSTQRKQYFGFFSHRIPPNSILNQYEPLQLTGVPSPSFYCRISMFFEAPLVVGAAETLVDQESQKFASRE